jgi:hypothetical protein
MKIQPFIKYLIGITTLFITISCCDCRDVAPVEVRYDIAHIQSVSLNTNKDLKYVQVYFFESSYNKSVEAGLFSFCDCTTFKSANNLTALKVLKVDTLDNVLSDVSERFVGSYSGVSTDDLKLFLSIPELIREFSKATNGNILSLVNIKEEETGYFIKVVFEFDDGMVLTTDKVEI